MQLNYLLFCDGAVLDAAAKMSMIGTFDRMYFRAFPASYPLMFAALEIVDIKDALLEITIKVTERETGKVIVNVTSRQRADLARGDRYRMLSRLEDVVFPAAGTYDAEIVVNGERLPAVSGLTALQS